MTQATLVRRALTRAVLVALLLTVLIELFYLRDRLTRGVPIIPARMGQIALLTLMIGTFLAPLTWLEREAAPPMKVALLRSLVAACGAWVAAVTASLQLVFTLEVLRGRGHVRALESLDLFVVTARDNAALWHTWTLFAVPFLPTTLSRLRGAALPKQVVASVIGSTLLGIASLAYIVEERLLLGSRLALFGAWFALLPVAYAFADAVVTRWERRHPSPSPPDPA